jgi:anti-anti-sigma factor
MPPDSGPGVQVDIVPPADNDAPVVVRLRGELDMAVVRTVDDQLAPLIARAERDVTVDMEDLGFIDVAGLNLLARAADALAAADQVLRLRAPSRILVRMLRVTGLDQHLQILEPGEHHD